MLALFFIMDVLWVESVRIALTQPHCHWWRGQTREVLFLCHFLNILSKFKITNPIPNICSLFCPCKCTVPQRYCEVGHGASVHTRVLNSYSAFGHPACFREE